MGNIVLLDDLTINKIAAGEVIERPASVIKEMVENSIDAGANNITVEIKNGGISYIKITDNGKGIAADDLEIAFERHATSKIRSADDLDLVTSMGFRGEALASIAAIANVELVSKTKEQETGFKIVVEAGNVLEKTEVGCQTGTSIIVRNLFFNTPVRYKFLKKDYTEAGYIEDVITRIALVNPDIAIKLINSGKTIIQTNGNGDLKSVIYSIYGKDVASGIVPLEYTYEDIQIAGVIGKPKIARSNRANQLFFVNKRFIKDKTLSAATEQAYKGLIPIGKFGFVVLNITINPSKVDVNVHPAKLEVRFEEEGKIFQAIYHAIKDILLRNELVSNSERVIENKEELDRVSVSESGLFDYKRNDINKIKEYNDEESRIKTNIESFASAFKVNVGQGGPVNTLDILEKLKQMKEEMQKDIGGTVDVNVENADENISIEQNEINDEGNNEVESEINSENEDLANKEVIVEKEVFGSEEEKNTLNENLENDYALDNSDEINVERQVQNLEKVGDAEDAQNVENVNNELAEDSAVNSVNDSDNENGADNGDIVDENVEKELLVTFEEMYEKMFGTKPINLEDENDEEVNQAKRMEVLNLLKDNISVFEQSEEMNKPVYKFIGIVFNTYIILEMDKEMYILDQHAAHERIMYEKVKKNYYSDSVKDSQMLLLPDLITLTHKEMDIARDNMDMFVRAGFELEEFGENTIKLTGVPTLCLDIDNKDLFMETLDEINSVARTAKQEKEEKFIATVACKAAVKANMVLDKAEVEKLMDELLKLPNPFTCPHGRPTAIKMTKYDIERKFARK